MKICWDICPWTSYVPQNSRSFPHTTLSENYLLFGTDNVCRQNTIRAYFTPDEDSSLYSLMKTPQNTQNGK